MPGNQDCTLFIGNLDEKKVSDRVLFEILIQAGRLVDMYIPRDKETNRPKGYAFAEYETEEIAEYAVRLFSGLVSLHKRTLRFAISGQDKASQNKSTPVTPSSNISLKRSQHLQPSNPEHFNRPPPFLTPPPVPGLGSVGYRSDLGASSSDYNRHLFGANFDSVGRYGTQMSRVAHTSRHPISYPSY